MRLLASTIILVSALVLYLPIVKAQTDCTTTCNMDYRYVVVHNGRFDDMLNIHNLVHVNLKVGWVSVTSFLQPVKAAQRLIATYKIVIRTSGCVKRLVGMFIKRKVL